MSVVKRKAERRIAPGGESRGRVEENRAKVCGATKAPDKNEEDQNGHGFADRLKKEESTDKPQFGKVQTASRDRRINGKERGDYGQIKHRR